MAHGNLKSYVHVLISHLPVKFKSLYYQGTGTTHRSLTGNSGLTFRSPQILSCAFFVQFTPGLVSDTQYNHHWQVI